MDFNIDDIRDNLTIIDKDNLIHAKGDEIININIVKSRTNNSFDLIIKAIAGLANLTDNESSVYKYIIDYIVTSDFNMIDGSIIDMTKTVREDIAKKLMISYSTVYRGIIGLVNKKILSNVYDTNYKIINGRYKINDNFNLAKFYSKDIKFITITL